MKHRYLAAFFALGGLIFGCTSLLGDFEVGTTPTPNGSSSGGTAEAGPGEGGTCTGPGCTSEDGSTGQCPDQGAFCDGKCWPKNDREHCGPSCAACTGTQVCDGKCIEPPAPEFDKVPRSATGWKDSANVALTITMKPTGQTGTKYECRTAPIAALAAAAWGNCDGASGDGATHQPKADATTPEGTYVTEYRYKLGAYTSPPIKTRYYVHKSLDGVATCPRSGNANDGPHFSDQQYFDAAKAFATANAAAFPTNGQFPVLGETRNDPLYLGNPWIKIPFVRITRSVAMNASQGFDDDPWPAANGNYLFNERSLRHRWVMSSDRTMILVARQYVHPKNNDCKQSYEVGNDGERSYGPPGRGERRLECEAFVVNSQGNGICINPNPTNASQPAVVPFDRRMPANAGATLGPVQVQFNATKVIYPAAAFGPTVAGNFIQIPDAPFGRWYRIANYVSPNEVLLSEPYAAGTQTVPARMATPAALGSAFVIPTGFAKLHQNAHAWATGKKRIPAITGTQIAAPRPSYRTKCETPGCNAGKPWLTYLPP